MESLGTLAGGIAHDFNNLLFQIMGSIQIVKKRLPESDRSVKNMSNALQAASRAKDLVQQILTFSRKSKSERQVLFIQPIIKEALKLLRSSLPATIQFDQHIDKKAGMILCDPTQIYQVLINLCTNAYHAMMAQEEAILTIEMKENKTEGVLELSVSDTGHGMKPEIVERIFDPYFTTKSTGEGTGLGLSIVHGIVSKHNGRIEVESKPGEGSRFKVILPLVQQSDNAVASSDQAPDLPTGNEHIMVVDDEELIMTMEIEILESLGYTVEGFSNSFEAFKRFQHDPTGFDLILTDQTMPKMTGIELSKRILELNKDARIILLTGFSENVTEDQARAAGIRQFLMKPLDMTKLAVTTREVLDAD
jgi:CheY-like chemotaxis protein